MKLFSTLALTAVFALASTAIGNAQFLTPYLSQDGVGPTRIPADDSLEGDAILVAIATSGAIDLSETGFPITAQGFNVEDGTSDFWAYQYVNSTNTDGIGVALFKVPFIGDQFYAERGNDFDLDPIALDLSGAYANSNSLVEQLKENSIYQSYREDFPDSSASFVVLSWRPDGSELLPSSFPSDSPVWAVSFNGAEIDIPEMACFVSSGTGETYCLRFSSGVDDENGTGGAIRVSPNMSTGDDHVTITLDFTSATMPQHLGLFDQNGREVVDLSAHIGSIHAGTPYEFSYSVEGLPSGKYHIGAVHDGTITTAPIVIAR